MIPFKKILKQYFTKKQATNTSLHSVKNEQSNKEISSELMNIKPIENTPFVTVNNEFIALGNYRMHLRESKTLEEQIQRIKGKNWDAIMEVIAIMIEINNKKQKTA